jgi:hypothetical protein
MKKTEKYRLVYIEWEDSYGCSPRWENVDNCSPSVMVCRSVGWLIYDGEKCKVIVPHMNQPENDAVSRQGCGDMTIPTSAIVKIADVGIVKRKKP